MSIIRKAMQIVGLSLDPPIDKGIRLSEDMQQTLALLCAYGVDQRILLRTSESGALRTIEPRIKDIWGHTATGDTEHKQGDNIACTKAIIQAPTTNMDTVWVRPYSQYVLAGNGANLAYEVTGGNEVIFIVSNINQLWFYFVLDTDKIVVLYSE